MAKFDIEDLVAELRTVMEDGLNAAIAAVEAEKIAAGKGFTPTLANIQNYHEQTWDDKVLQHQVTVFYGLEDIETTDIGGGPAKKLTLFAEIVYVDNGMANDGWKRVQRYSRALEELLTAQSSRFNSFGSSPRIEQVRPFAFKNESNTSEEVKVGGVSLSVTLF